MDGHWSRTANLVYSLKHAGWNKGKELFENDMTITVHCNGHGMHKVEREENLAKQIQHYLNSL